METLAVTAKELEKEGLEAIETLLKHWDQEFFQVTTSTTSVPADSPPYESGSQSGEAEEEQQVPQEESRPTELSKSEAKWIFYTRHKGTTVEPPRSIFTTIFSQPTPTCPVPRATASITFTHVPGKPLSFVFETGKLSYSPDTVSVMGSPLKRLKEIIQSKEDTAAYFSKYQSAF